mmetsp:Transcript_33743/g.46246  ORF Transcript_33743/g.46246 Transcript_33743/m.46246 type:complete len:376 (+) Transcript_33743:17-1144(+)
MDEPIVVVDVGSSSIKAGFSGEDMPSYVYPSTISTHHRTIESVESPFADYSAAHSPGQPIYRGAIKDWDQMEKLWQNLTEQVNITSSDEISILLIESPRSTAYDRTKWAEMMFEVFRAPSLCIGNSASLTIFASGRTTGLAVECGAGITSTTPVFEGLPLKHAAICIDFGGQDISMNLKKLFNDKNIDIDLTSAKIVKEKLSFVAENNASNSSKVLPTSTFCLPDGTDVTIDTKLLSSCTDSLFTNKKTSIGGLINQVHESIVLCDDSVKRELAHNIIISGGTSMLPGLGDRLNNDLIKRFTAEPEYKYIPLTNQTIRVVPNSGYSERGYTSQRKHAAWVGGSIISSFDTYHKCLKITRQEWEESPDAVLHAKCF